jgi:endonuclease/exonuclease/phosphatase family metal-dependent hydrolase
MGMPARPWAALALALALALSPGAQASAEPTPPPSSSSATSPAPLGPSPSGSPGTGPSGSASPALTPTPTPVPPGTPVVTWTTARATMVALSWAPIPDAAGYRVHVVASPGSTVGVEQSVTMTAAVVSGLRPHTDYWVRVVALDAAGLPLGPPSADVKVSTTHPFETPWLEVTAPNSVRLQLDWTPPAPRLRLSVEWKRKGAKLKKRILTDRSYALDGARPDTAYTFRARWVDRKGRTMSAWTEPVTVTTPAGDPLRVGSYNILCANCRDWGPRREAVADTIREQQVDVVGLQEASAGRLKGRNRTQFEDLLTLLPDYRAVNSVRFNCKRSHTSKKCRKRNRGASGAVRILYNPKTVTLLEQGSTQLADLPGTGKDRFVAWAIFRHKVNGKRFFFADTHLEPRNDTGGSTTFYRIRREQAKTVARTIAAHRRGLPVVAVGDFNSTKWDVPTNAPYDTMLGAGFVDPLGNSYRSRSNTKGATVQKRVNTEFSSYNNYLDRARRTDGVNGSNPDYIFVSSMPVLEYETVVKVDTNGRFVGVLPSDHNMLRATVWLS